MAQAVFQNFFHSLELLDIWHVFQLGFGLTVCCLKYQAITESRDERRASQGPVWESVHEWSTL